MRLEICLLRASPGDVSPPPPLNGKYNMIMPRMLTENAQFNSRVKKATHRVNHLFSHYQVSIPAALSKLEAD